MNFDFDLILYTLFASPIGFFEIYISKKKYLSPESRNTQSKDRGTLIITWLIISFSQAFSIHCACLGYGAKIIEDKSLKSFFWIPLNITLYLSGILLRKQSTEQLGKWFTTAIRIEKDQQLIDFGWYEKMRHPSYTGFLLYFCALALFLNNWLSLFGTMIPISLAILYRIHVEEQELENYFGVKHQEYRRKVPNILIPKIL